MQTFLPFPDYRESAACLDRQRLGKQRVEGLQLLHTLTGKKVIADPTLGPRVVDNPNPGWVFHPCIKMWQHNPQSLAIYTTIVCDEWVRRGYLDTVKQQIRLLFPGLKTAPTPKWLGDEAFHLSHRSNLMRKMPEHYFTKLGWIVRNDLPYIWPQG